MLARNLYISSNALKYNNNWVKNGGFQIRNKKIGIIGLGFIGKEVVKLLKPFNCEIFANDIKDLTKYAKDNNIKLVNKETILKSCDFVSIHTPLDESTSNMISSKELGLMKNTSFIINTARGEL